MKKVKKIIFAAAALVILAAMTVTSLAAGGWTAKQDTAHEIAELARSMGLPEDDPIIKRASEIWWQEDAERKAEAAKPKLTSIGRMYITGYDNCSACCGKWAGGPTASGVMPTVNHTVAMSAAYPFGTRIYIDGLGYYTVEDRGVGSGTVDVYCNNHSECYAITGYYQVYLVEG